MNETRDLTTTQGGLNIALTIDSMESLEKLCTKLAQSNVVPKNYIGRPGDIFVAILHGRELGIPPLQALASIAVINGIPSIYGDMGLAIVRSSGLLEDYYEEIVGEGDEMKSVIRSKRRGMQREIVTEFSVADAKIAGLWGKAGPWQQYKKRMLMFRNRGFHLRDNYGDLLKGLIFAEEARDIVMERADDGTFSPATPTEDASEPETDAEAGKGKKKLASKMKMPKAAAAVVETPTTPETPPAETAQEVPHETHKEVPKEDPPKAAPAKKAAPAARGAAPAEPQAATDHELATVVTVKMKEDPHKQPFAVLTVQKEGHPAKDVFYRHTDKEMMDYGEVEASLGSQIHFLWRAETVNGKTHVQVFDLIPSDIYEQVMTERAAQVGLFG